MVLRDGKLIARQAGTMPLPALRDWVQGALAQSQLTQVVASDLIPPRRAAAPRMGRSAGCVAARRYPVGVASSLCQF
jgi:hypothetical protein